MDELAKARTVESVLVAKAEGRTVPVPDVVAPALERIETLQTYLEGTTSIRWVDTLEGLEQALKDVLSRDEVIGLDIETARKVEHPMAGLVPAVSRISTVQVAVSGVCYVVDALALGVQWVSRLNGRPVVAHNAQFEDEHLRHAGVGVDLQCTLLLARIYQGAHAPLSLKDLCMEAFELDIDKSLQVSDWSRRPLLPEQVSYAAADAVLARDLWHAMNQHFVAEEPDYRLTYDFVQTLVRPTTDQQLTGIRLDIEAHDAVIAGWRKHLEAAAEVMASQGLAVPAGKKKFTVADGQKYLKARLTPEELAAWPRTKGGQLSTSAKEIAGAGGAESVKHLTTWSKMSTLLTNFGEKLQSLAIDGVLYPRYRVIGMSGGRWTATEPNFQNMPRSGLKHCFVPVHEGWSFVAADLSQVELRVAALLSEDPVMLEAYADGKDLHMLMARQMFERMSAESIAEQRAIALVDAAAKAEQTAEQFESSLNDEKRHALLMQRLRQGAKGCIAKGSLVLTDNGLKPIESVSLSDKVWDGIEWVEHEGVVFQGIQEVIDYDGLTATPDHRVWTEECGKVCLGHAAAQRLRLTRTGDEAGRPVTIRDKRPSAWDAEEGGRAPGGRPAMQGVWHHQDDQRRQPAGEEVAVMPMSDECEVPGQADSKDSRREIRLDGSEVPQADACEQRELPRQRDRSAVRVEGELYPVGDEHVAGRDLQGQGPGQNQQRWALRAGKSAACHSGRESEKSTHHPDHERRRGAGSSMRCVARAEGETPRPDVVGEDGHSAGVRGQEHRGHPESTAKTEEVYDIVNAGPRHRFTVSGRLVANCNFGLLYGSGPAGLQKYCRQTYGVKFTLEEAKLFCDIFHTTYAGYSLWQKLILAHAKETYCVESHAFRLPRFFRESDFYTKGAFSDIFTEPMNHPVQSSAWEVMAVAVRHIHRHADPRLIRVSHHVYDEVVVQARDDQVQQAAALILDAFEAGYQTVFPGCSMVGIAEVGVGKSWAAAGLESNLIEVVR